ncbi:N-acetylglucosamine-6-phosphate deacetylase [Zooshikella ganghwensis]|uniref:N-acetylglucosamine-6-phosphate deacetylase n=1 Tax=Zooshikella ganghwensis TaxID=202772 RepID=UPI000422BB70|nr:N-acetylglucosamine-6-phosphate deacetylase [Zooshikella ganghwensis]
MYALINGRIFTSEETLEQHAVVIENALIKSLVPTSTLPNDIKKIDLQGLNVSPGFIDLQLNGCGGRLFNDDISAETLDIMHKTNLRHGTTHYLATLITANDAQIKHALETVKNYKQNHSSVLGLHLEGPYINRQKKGIHDPDQIRPYDLDMIKLMADYGGDTLKVVTLAPELTTAEIIQLLIKNNITVSAGHSLSDYNTAQHAFQAGISMATHLFNAMPSISARTPGLAAAILDNPNVFAGIIVDGVHVDYPLVKLAKKLKHQHLFLVTDAVSPAGTNMTAFKLGPHNIQVKNGQCIAEDGTIGGSALTMNNAIINCVNHVGIELAEALRMATLYPAKAINQGHHLGKIAPGYSADLAIFDNSLNVTAAVSAGQWHNTVK